MKSGSEESTVIDIVNHTISDLIENGIRKRELEKSINGYKSSFIYSLQNLDTFANQINSYNCSLGEPNSFIFDLNRYQKLKEKDIQNAASKYLKNYNVELLITPKIK